MLLSRLALSSLALSGRYCGIGGSHVIGRSMGGVRMMSLPTDEAKALHALGFNIGTQLGDIKVGFDESEIDYILSGIKASLSDEPPDVPLSEYVPRAAAMIQAKKAKMSEDAPYLPPMGDLKSSSAAELLGRPAPRLMLTNGSTIPLYSSALLPAEDPK